MQRGWVKLPRDFLDFEYYKDAQTKGIFIHLLLTAEYSPRRLHGVELDAGEALTTLKELSAKTGASTSQTRTALTRLQRAGKIAIRTTNKFSVITLINAGFQDDNEPEISKQNDKDSEKESTNKSQTKLTEFNKPSYLCKKEEKELEKEKVKTCATVEELRNNDVNGAPELELIDGELSDEEAARIDANCAAMLTFVDQPEVIEMLQYVDTVKDDLRLTDCSEYLALCKITKKYSWKRVRDAINAAIAHEAQNSVNYIRRFCENGGC